MELDGAASSGDPGLDDFGIMDCNGTYFKEQGCDVLYHIQLI